MRPLPLLAFALCACLAGCKRSDIGTDCPALLGGADPGAQGDTRSVTLEVVAQDLSFPCEEMICIATAGRPGYCSKKCREDAGCPQGFVCREIQPIGIFAGEKFCAWRPCATALECGKKGEFCCKEALGAEVAERLMFCDFATDGKCE